MLNFHSSILFFVVVCPPALPALHAWLSTSQDSGNCTGNKQFHRTPLASRCSTSAAHFTTCGVLSTRKHACQIINCRQSGITRVTFFKKLDNLSCVVQWSILCIILVSTHLRPVIKFNREATLWFLTQVISASSFQTRINIF